MRYVQNALPGNEDAGCAKALVGVDGEGRGIRVEALPIERDVIEFDPNRSCNVTHISSLFAHCYGPVGNGCVSVARRMRR